jgi:CIC family chloride channel protein
VERQRLLNIYLLAFSITIGLLAATGALVFRTLIEIFQELFWATGSGFLEKALTAPWWMRLLIPMGGGLLIGPIITYLVPEAKGPGVPEVILSVATRQSTIRHRVTFLKAIVTSLLIGSGASVGREGPIAQIGASVGSSLAQLFRLNPDLRRVCLASGAAAGIAATFNAPITGTLFAVEIILLDIEIVYISHIIIASVIASVLSRIFWGEFPTFTAGAFQLASYGELTIYLLLGLVSGMVAIGFVRAIYSTDTLFQGIRMPDWLKPACGGLLLGLIALKLPHVLGVGYETVNLALDNSLGLKLAILLLFAKAVATSVCIGSGMSGGIFAPSLVLGATLGTVMALVINAVAPELDLISSNYALAGMGAVVAGTTLAPITAILTIFELTYNYQIMLPLMIACMSSAIVVKLFFGYSAYEIKLLKKGVAIVRGHDIGILQTLQVGKVMIGEYESLLDSTPLPAIVERVVKSSYPHFIVLNQREELVGVLSTRDLKESLDKLDVLENIVIAADIMTKEVATISVDETLEKALYIFEKMRISFLPVMNPADPNRVMGILKKDDMLQAYQERVLKDQILSSRSR